MTPAHTSSLRHLLSNLQANIFAPNCVAALLIHLIMMPLVPLVVPYFFFICSVDTFSMDLSSRINVGSIPRIGNPVICAISSIVMGTGLSSHMSPPCVTSNSCLMQVVAYWPLPKCSRFNNPKIHVFSKPTIHWCGWLIGSPNWFVLVVCINTFCARSGNLVLSDTSWYEYLSFLTWPSRSVPSCTLTSMRGRTIFVVGFLRGELGIYTLSFYYGGWLEVPVSFVYSLVSHSSQAEAFSTVSSIG
jgi:hypothetical protein